MGYSCTMSADEVFMTWTRYCTTDTGMSNVYSHNGSRYCLQIGKEQRDGAMTGTVLRLEATDIEGQSLAYASGSWRIDADGTVKRYPVGLKQLLGDK